MKNVFVCIYGIIIITLFRFCFLHIFLYCFGPGRNILGIRDRNRKLQVKIYPLVMVRLWDSMRHVSKNEMAFEITKFERSRKKTYIEIEIEPNDHYQNVALGLEFLLEGSKPQNIPSRTNK